MTIALRRVTEDADLETLARITNDVTPDDPTSLDDMRWSDATYPGTTRLLAAVDGVDVGLGTIGRVFVMPPDYPYLWASIIVRPESRRHGVGEALLIALSRIAVQAGKVGLQGRVSTARPDRSQARGPGWQRALSTGYDKVPTRLQEPGRSAASFAAKPRADLAIGMRVFHEKFGYGEVVGQEGNKLEIEFETSGRKRVIDSFVRVA